MSHNPRTASIARLFKWFSTLSKNGSVLDAARLAIIQRVFTEVRK